MIPLIGFTSTTLKQQVALKYAAGDSPEPNPLRQPVIFEIEMEQGKGYIELGNFSAYPDEEEIIL